MQFFADKTHFTVNITVINYKIIIVGGLYLNKFGVITIFWSTINSILLAKTNKLIEIKKGQEMVLEILEKRYSHLNFN